MCWEAAPAGSVSSILTFPLNPFIRCMERAREDLMLCIETKSDAMIDFGIAQLRTLGSFPSA